MVEQHFLFLRPQRIGISLKLELFLIHGSKRVEYLVSLFEEIKKSGPLPNVRSYTIMMNFYCKGHYAVDIGQAAGILEEMESGESPTVVTYSTYIHGLRRIGFVEFALNLIRKLRQKYQPVNSYCYNAVIDGFCKRGEEDESLRVMEEMKSCGISPDVYSYSILIFGFCKNGNVEKGLSLMEKMESSYLKPSLVSYASLLKGFCNSGLMETSLDMLYKLRASGYKCDQTAYDKLINGFSMQGDLDTAQNLFEEMASNNLVPNASNFENMIYGFCKIGSLDKALELFNIMLEGGHLYEVLQLINGMRDQGILPNRCIYNAVISRLCKEKKPEKAWELIPVMLKSNLLPEAVIYSTIIDGFATFCKIGDMKKAWGLFSEMLQTGHLPSVVTYTCLIDGFCKANWMDIAHLLADELRRKKVSPDVFSYNVLIAGYRRLGNLDRAHELFKETRKEVVVFPWNAEESLEKMLEATECIEWPECRSVCNALMLEVVKTSEVSATTRASMAFSCLIGCAHWFWNGMASVVV
ncbi:unnamed protein product [Camellia sinensis]